MQTIILNLNHYNWFVSKKRFVSKIGYIDFVPLSRKLSLELEFKDMKQTQYVDKTKDDLSPIFAKSPSLHNRRFENVLFIKLKCGTRLNGCDETKELFALNSKESYFELCYRPIQRLSDDSSINLNFSD